MWITLSLFVSLAIVLYAHGYLLSTDICNGLLNGTIDMNDNIAQLYQLGKKLDEDLVPSQFSRVVDGYYVFIVDEEEGENSGGGTNTFGAYGAFFFNGTEILPDGFCDFDAYDHSHKLCLPDDSTMSFSLGPADAIAFYGCTPPPMRYFSYDVDLNIRTSEEFIYYIGQPFGDAISNRNINISTSNNSDKFNQPHVLIHAANGATADTISKAYQKYGIDRTAVSIRGLTDETIRLWDRSISRDWQQSRPDIMNMVSRITLPLPGYEAQFKAFQKLIWPVKFYFAEDTKKATTPLHPPLNSRYSTSLKNEVEILGDVHEQLITAVTKRFNSLDAILTKQQTLNLTTKGFYDDWDTIIADKNNNSYVVETRDATYGFPSLKDLSGCVLKHRTSAVLVGVNHRTLNDMSYNSVGLSVYGFDNFNNEKKQLVALETHWFYDTQLLHSAERYLPDNKLAKYLFAVDFMQPGECVGTAHPQWCVEFNESSIRPLQQPAELLAGERMYSTTATGIGMAANISIPASVLIFTRQE